MHFVRSPLYPQSRPAKSVGPAERRFVQSVFVSATQPDRLRLRPVRVLVYSLEGKLTGLSTCRVLSVDLWVTDTTKDLMTKFVDCLVRLPNLRTLDIFVAGSPDSTKQELERKCARFPSIRELWVCSSLVELVGNCPNVESVRVMGAIFPDIEILCLHGKSLGRVAGVQRDQIQLGELTVPF